MRFVNIRLAIRNLRKRSIYSLINITGLGIASAFAILVSLFIIHENSIDRFHQNGKQLYRLELTNFFSFGNTNSSNSFFSFLYEKDKERNMIRIPPVLPVDVAATFPEVSGFVRMKVYNEMNMRLHNRVLRLTNQRVAFAENNFFKVFSFPLLTGSATEVLRSPANLVISESAAKKYFGTTDVIGKTLEFRLREYQLFTIAAVMKDFPAASSMQFEMVLPLEAEPGFAKALSQGINQYSHLAILQIKEGTDIVAFEKKLDAYCASRFSEAVKNFNSYNKDQPIEQYHAWLRPLALCHFNISDGWFRYTDNEKIYQLVSLTVVILLIVCINYILLALTSTASRSLEVGIRKTAGAARKQIVVQFWAETQLLVLLAVAVGYIIAVLSLPYFNYLTGFDLSFHQIPLATIAVVLLLLSVVLGLLAGIYPALAISGLAPLKIMRKHATYKLNPRLSGVFVTLQYATCIVLIISAIAIGRQMQFMLTKDMGFDKEQVMLIAAPEHGGTAGQLIKERLYHFAATQSAIEKTTATGFSFANGFNLNSHTINGKSEMVTELNVDYGYFDLNKIPILKGRDFSSAIASDTIDFEIPPALRDTLSSSTNRAIVVNETLYNMLGKPAIGEINKPMGSRIIGVCRDYHFWGLTQKIGPAYHLCSPQLAAYYWIKIRSGQNIPDVIDKIKKEWSTIAGNVPFEFSFLDESVQRFYEPYQKWMRTVALFSWLAVFLACLGFFGLSGLHAINRTKEIGIRKVIGASVTDIFMLLNRQNVLLLFLSVLVAVPVASYFVHEWLQNFAYRTEPGWIIYLLAAGAAFICALVAVLYHTIKVAVTNPVQSLRSE